MRRQDSSGSTADKVAQALVARKQQSETPEFLRRRHTLNAVSGTGGVDVLAEIRKQKEKGEKETVAKEKEDKQTERSVTRKLFTDTEALKDKLEEVKGTSPEAPVTSSGEVCQTSSASRRKKSVEKPIKTLGIVSEPRDNSGGPTTRMGRRPRRQKSVEKPVKTLEIVSDPEPPAWVAIAQVHRHTQIDRQTDTHTQHLSAKSVTWSDHMTRLTGHVNVIGVAHGSNACMLMIILSYDFPPE